MQHIIAIDKVAILTRVLEKITIQMKALAWVVVRKKQQRYTGDEQSQFCYTWCAGENDQHCFGDIFVW